MSSTYVIAEVGSNHGGDLSAMKRAVALYAPAADAVKLQWTNDAGRVARRRGAVKLREAYERYLQWPVDWHAEIAAACHYHGCDYMCTVFLPEDVGVIAEHVDRYKVSSFEARDGALAAAYESTPRRATYVSTGMLDVDTVQAAIGLWAGALGEHVVFMHCVSAYPAPVEELQLDALRRSGWLTAFSDHSDPSVTVTGALAVAAGAEAVEAHVRVPGQSPNLPDYRHAMTSRQFSSYVGQVRLAEQLLGEGPRRVQPSEQEMTRYTVIA